MSRSILWKSFVVLFGCAMLAFTVGAGSVSAASVGQVLSNPQLKDADDRPTTIPGFGTHVISVIYADSSAADFADPMADALKMKNYNRDVYRGVGVADMKDSIVPNFIIRKIVKGKIEKYKETILTDVDLSLPKAWGLGDCKGKSVFMLIGKDKTLKYIKYADKNNLWNKTDVDATLKVMDDLILKK